MSKSPTVVAFIGKRGSGKSTAAQALIDAYGFKDVKFAEPLKNMLRAFCYTADMTNEETERWVEGDLKEVPAQILGGKTPRHAMQTLGTEWRDFISTTLWSDILLRRISNGSCGKRVVVSDYRFPHETLALNALGAKVIRIDGRDTLQDEASQHLSETAMDTLPYDFRLVNGGTVQDLRNDAITLAISKGWHQV